MQNGRPHVFWAVACRREFLEVTESRAVADVSEEQLEGRVPARSFDPDEVWAKLQRGEARLLDLRTAVERHRYGTPPGAVPVSLAWHLVKPQGAGAIYLCQHAVRSKLTLRGGAAEVAGGFLAWQNAGLPIEPVKRGHGEQLN